jgi:hypothetical protein
MSIGLAASKVSRQIAVMMTGAISTIGASSTGPGRTSARATPRSGMRRDRRWLGNHRAGFQAGAGEIARN